MEDLLSLKWKNHCLSFLEVIKVIRAEQMYSDVTLACEGKFYNVHKMVLTACSDYFREIFYYTESRNPVIVLKDIKPTHLESLIDYMYTGEVNVKQVDISSLMKAAECLEIKGLAVPDGETGTRNNSISPNNSLKHKFEHIEPSSDYVNSPLPKVSKCNTITHTQDVKESSSAQVGSLTPNVKKSNENIHMKDIRNDIETDHEKIDIIKEESIDHMQSEPFIIEDARCMQDEKGDRLHISNPLNYPSQMDVEKYRKYYQSENMSLLNGNQMQKFPQNQSLQDDDTWKYPIRQKCNIDEWRINSIIGNCSNKGECPYCMRVFPYQSLLRNHIRVHTGEKPFACNFCSYHSNQKGNLKTHLTTIHNYTFN